ncbi:MAG: trypsin-like peptidase domain-containing protein [Thermoleophilia bacterium]|nr:trypsin-like peptidase domain-containing protein [Thermoleophilia bacterium]
MTISATGGIRIPDHTTAQHGLLSHGRIDSDRGDAGGIGAGTIGLLAAGGVGLAGGLALRGMGHGRIGTAIAAIGGALLGVSLLTACGTTPKQRISSVPGDEGPPGHNVDLVAGSLGDLATAGTDSTNPAPDGWKPSSGSRDAREGVVQIETSTGLGSGWVVKPGKVVTNYHVAQGYDRVNVIGQDGAEHAGTVLRMDRQHDLALVEVPDLTDAPLAMDDVVEDGELGETTGYPGGTFHNDAAAAAGTIDITDDGRRRSTLLFAGSSAQGVSGGAVINGAGEVLGTSFAVGTIGTSDTEIVLAIPNDQVREFLAAGAAPAETAARQ